MNTALKVTLLSILTLAASSALAESRPQKQPLQVDFNKMIDDNNVDRGALDKAAPEIETAAPGETVAEGRRKVIDFIDMEVGLGATDHVVKSN